MYLPVEQSRAIIPAGLVKHHVMEWWEDLGNVPAVGVCGANSICMTHHLRQSYLAQRRACRMAHGRASRFSRRAATWQIATETAVHANRNDVGTVEPSSGDSRMTIHTQSTSSSTRKIAIMSGHVKAGYMCWTTGESTHIASRAWVARRYVMARGRPAILRFTGELAETNEHGCKGCCYWCEGTTAKLVRFVD